MPLSSATGERIRFVLLVVCAVVVLLVVVGVGVVQKQKAVIPGSPASTEAKSYLAYLQLGDVAMSAAENLMQQQVVYVDGTIRNNGSRSIRQIDVFCLFVDVHGQEIGRKKATVVNTGLEPKQTRSFRLTFEALPADWNQALPRMVIAQINFE